MAVLLITGCGTEGLNVGIDGTGVLTYRDVVSYGRVRALGVVQVNGALYDVQGSSFTINSRLGSAADLDVGDIVLLQGKMDEASGRGVAQSIVSDHVLQGRIESVNPAGGSLQVLAQNVLVGTDTSLDPAISGGLAGLAAGDAINVSGFRNIQGAVVATRLERQPAGPVAFKTTGAITQVARSDMRLQIEGLVVDYSGAVFSPADASSQFERGVFVEVKGTSPSPGLFIANSVEVKRKQVPGTAAIRADVEGYVTGLDTTDASRIRIDGLPVSVSSATVIQGGDLTTGDRVTVSGDLSSAGTVIAKNVLTSPAIAAPKNAFQGRVFDAIAGPVADVGVHLWVETGTSGYSYTWAAGGKPPRTGPDGRFTANVGGGPRVVVEGIDSPDYVMPCAVSGIVTTDRSFEVEVVPKSRLDASNPPPPVTAAGTVTMSGQIYEMTAAGRQPVAGALVGLEEGVGIVIATTMSDRNGHYLICGLPPIGEHELGVGYPGFDVTTVYPVNTAQSTVLDIEMRRKP